MPKARPEVDWEAAKVAAKERDKTNPEILAYRRQGIHAVSDFACPGSLLFISYDMPVYIKYLINKTKQDLKRLIAKEKYIKKHNIMICKDPDEI